MKKGKTVETAKKICYNRSTDREIQAYLSILFTGNEARQIHLMKEKDA